jgi:membrane protease YdiL (CAAX protease family)
MNLFAAAPLTNTRLDLALWVEVIVVFYLLLACFIRVSTYVAKRFWAGKLVDGINAPLPIRLPSLSGWLFVTCVIGLLFLQSPFYYLVVPGGIAVYLTESGKSMREQFGLERLFASRLAKWSLLICGAVYFVEIPLDALVQAGFNAFNLPHPDQQTVVAFRQFDKPSQIFAFLVQAVVLSPLLEELFFRGFLQTYLKNYTSTWLAIVLSAGVFAFAHVNLGSALQLWFLGIALGIAYEHTGALLLPVGIHGCFNFATALSLLVEKCVT